MKRVNMIDIRDVLRQHHELDLTPYICQRGSIRNFVLWAIVMKKKGASYGNREGTIGPAVGGA